MILPSLFPGLFLDAHADVALFPGSDRLGIPDRDGAGAIGIPLGSFLARKRMPGRPAIIRGFRAAMAVPTVFIGLVCYGLFARRGPLGDAELLFTPWAIVVGEVLLALPIITSITHGAIRSLDDRIADTAYTLGAGSMRRWVTYLSAARGWGTLGMLTAFARCVTELGIAMMVGGNIKGHTRTLATATALETARGEFAIGLAMGLILLAMALAVTVAIVSLSRIDRR